MSRSCRALEQACEPGTFKSDDSSKTADPQLPKSNVENSSQSSMNAFTQTEKHDDTESVSDDNDMSVVEDVNASSESSETDEDCKTATNPKLISVHKSSEDDESDSSVPDDKNQIIKKRQLIEIRQSSEDNYTN